MRPILLLTALASACGNPSADPKNVTTVILTFTPVEGGDEVTGEWARLDPDNEPEITGIVLANATEYYLSTSFLNEEPDPTDDLTAEVRAEAEAHQVFYTGNAVDGPATGSRPNAPVEHSYDDADSNGLPLGLDNRVHTRGSGSGNITITLRHMPEQMGTLPKSAELPTEVATSGFGTVPGTNDIQVTLGISVE